jgi:hypothetical protein
MMMVESSGRLRVKKRRRGMCMKYGQPVTGVDKESVRGIVIQMK